MDRDELIEAAKWAALGLARSDHSGAPNPHRQGRRPLRLCHAYSATSGTCTQSHQISEPTTSSSGDKLANIMSAAATWRRHLRQREARFHELEQEAFLSLCGEQKTLERIQYMLTNNKPLRN
jgi:hypothetical protein